MRVVINGRFYAMETTGVQRVARALVGPLADAVGDVVVAVPGVGLVDAADEERLDAVPAGPRWHGVRGHGWEQAVLPSLVRRAGRRAVLFSPASWGPVAVARQVVLVTDIAPQLYPEYYATAYRALAGVLTPLLVRRAARIIVLTPRIEGDLVRVFGAEAGRVDVVAPGVGPPFTTRSLDDIETRPARYCVAVGAHDRRKNIAFLAELWPRVHADTGLELVVTRRAGRTVRFADPIAARAGIRLVEDPSDDELCELYAGALCLLWPSFYEGYGLPLLEAMAVGTPFLSTDTGAAPELALEADHVLPMVADAWVKRVTRLHAQSLAPLRRLAADGARARSWPTAAAGAAASLDRVS